MLQGYSRTKPIDDVDPIDIFSLENNKYLHILFHSKIDLKTPIYPMNYIHVHKRKPHSQKKEVPHRGNLPGTMVISSEISTTIILAVTALNMR